jgi:hypothetical protein
MLNAPTHPTVISQPAGVSGSLAQREGSFKIKWESANPAYVARLIENYQKGISTEIKPGEMYLRPFTLTKKQKRLHRQVPLMDEV